MRTITEISLRLEELAEEQNKLLEELKLIEAGEQEIKPWRADSGSYYYDINSWGEVDYCSNFETDLDVKRHIFGNYYRTRELAEQDAKELALRGYVRQLRDSLCEGFDCTSGDKCWFVYYDTRYGKYETMATTHVKAIGGIFFDTRDHADAVRDILNEEIS